MNSIFYVAIALFFWMATLGFWVGGRDENKLGDDEISRGKHFDMAFCTVIFAFFAIAMTIVASIVVWEEYHPPDIEQQTITCLLYTSPSPRDRS